VTRCVTARGFTLQPVTRQGGGCLPRAQARAVLRRAFSRETTSSPDMYAAAARNWGEPGRLRRVFAKLLRGTWLWFRLGSPFLMQLATVCVQEIMVHIMLACRDGGWLRCGAGQPSSAVSWPCSVQCTIQRHHHVIEQPHVA
jgi:hypothetical protein